MKILSVYLGHNSTIAYMKDGKLEYVLHEEKFDNVKNSDNFPCKALQYLASKEDISSIDKITVVGRAINFWMLRHIENYTKQDKHKIINFEVTLYDRILYFLMKYFPRFMNWVNDTYISMRKKKYTESYIQLIEQGIGQKIPREKIEFISHHECHTLSVIYFYGLHKISEPVLVFTMDGGGDRHCATVRIRKDGKLETLATVRNWYSIGDLRSKAFTGGMGMQPLEHEYKVMGLAAYTSKKYYQSTYDRLFKNTVKLKGLTRTSKVPGNKSHIYYHNKLWGLRFDNIAGALQEYTEEIVLQWIKNGIEQTGIKKIAVAGGVFMNVKLNQRIHESDFVEKVYFMPSAGDDSTPLGGVLAGYLSLGADLKKLPSVESMYQGVRYTDNEVKNQLKKYESTYDIIYFDNEQKLTDTIADLLAAKEIVAIFHGAGERGARSLCNRAILANASSLESFFTVNDMIKMRDFWMPFAPTILEEWAPKYLKNWDVLKNKVSESARYMITTFDSTQLAQTDLRAALHQKDKTLRPQLVNQNTNPRMYDILKKYEERTGMGGVMNTSLNIHGYPLVGTVDQAIFTLENSGMNTIVVNNALIRKKK